MASDYGRHDADDSASDRARVDYLAGETNVELDPADQAELDELRELARRSRRCGPNRRQNWRIRWSP